MGRRRKKKKKEGAQPMFGKRDSEVKVEIPKLAIYFDSRAHRKLRYFVQATTEEISGLGIVEKGPHGYEVRDVFILEQKCSAASTTLEQEAISKLMVEMIQQGKDPGKLKLWWHSHANMGVFWSTTDETCIENLENNSFMISIVTNRRGEMMTRLDLYQPFPITLNNIPVQTIQDEDDDLKKECLEEVEKKVTKSYFGRTVICEGGKENGKVNEPKTLFKDYYGSYYIT